MSFKKQFFQATFSTVKKSDKSQYKALASETKEIEGTVVKGYASTTAEDRHGDIVEPQAFRETIVNNYSKNPIILFQHNRNRPVGKVTHASIDSKGLYIEGVIVDPEIEPKVQAGILKCFSIGFIPQEVEYKDKESGRILDPENKEDFLKIIYGEAQRIFKKIELVENSIVSVPSNPDALFTIGKSLDLCCDEKFAEKVLKETKEAIVFSIEGEKEISFKTSEGWDRSKVMSFLRLKNERKNLNKTIMPGVNLLDLKEKTEDEPKEAIVEDVESEKEEEESKKEIKEEPNKGVVETLVVEKNDEKNVVEKDDEDKKEDLGLKEFGLPQEVVTAKNLHAALAEVSQLRATNKQLEEKVSTIPTKKAQAFCSAGPNGTAKEKSPQFKKENSPKKEEFKGFKAALKKAAL